MNCEQAQSRLDSYLDGELDEFSLTELEAHLRSCSNCERLLAQARRLPELYCGILPRFTPPPDLAVKIRSSIREKSRPPFFRSPFLWLSTAALAAACLAVIFSVDPERQIRIEAVRAFTVAQAKNHFCDIASTDPSVVQPWLAGKLGYSPPVVTLPEYSMRGGRIERIRNHPIAALIYEKNKQIINVFVWPAQPNERLAETDWSDKNCSFCVWNRAGLNFAVVGNVSAEEMDAFEDQLRDKLAAAGS